VSHAKTYTKDKPNHIKTDSKEKDKKEFTLSKILISLVVFVVRSLMADSDCQSDEWGDQNDREMVEEGKK